MTTTDTTPRSQTESISFEFDLQHAPEKVWRALTTPELLSQWLLPVIGLELQPGASFTLQAPPQPAWDGTVSCRFIEIEAPTRISWRWIVGDPSTGSGEVIDTIVTFTLTPTASGTRLSLVQSGFKPHQKHNAGGARYGWKMMGEKLTDLLARIS